MKTHWITHQTKWLATANKHTEVNVFFLTWRPMSPQGGQCHSTLKTFFQVEYGLVDFNVVNVLPWLSASPESKVRRWNSDLSSGSFWDLLRLTWVLVWVEETKLAAAEAMLAVMLWLSLSDSGKKTFLSERIKPWYWHLTIGRDIQCNKVCWTSKVET